jgi:hypothetical protein
MKKRVCILFSGQTRCSGLNPEYVQDNIIIESLRSYLLNDKFKEQYNFDVFIATDKIDINKAYELFGEDNIKNICLYETNWLLNKCECNIHPFEYYANEYSKINFNGCDAHPSGLFMLYRLHLAYILMKNYQNKTGTTYDYIVKLRPDSKLSKDIMPLFDILETTDVQIISEHDHFAIVKSEFSDVFNLIGNYGKYNEHCDNKKMIYSYLTRDGRLDSNKIICYCPEKQYTDHIYFIIKSRNLQFDQIFQGIIYPNYTSIYRGNGVYAYM